MIGGSVFGAFLRRGGVAAVVAAALFCAAARAADWSPWQPVADRYGSGIDVRYRQSSVPNNNGGGREIEYQFRNRYPQKVTARIEFDGWAVPGGARKAALVVALEPGEQKNARSQRAPLQKIDRAYVVEIQFAGEAPAAADSDEVRRLRELLVQSRRELDLREAERHQAERLAARTRFEAEVPEQKFLRLDTRPVTVVTVNQAEQRVREAARRVEVARRAVDGLEAQLRAAEGEWTGLLEAARRLAAENKWAEAEIACEKLVRQSPQSGLHRANLGVTLRNQNKLPEAEAAFREAVGRDPGCAEFHNGLGEVLSVQSRWADAEAPLREAVRLAPGVAAYHADLGRALLPQKKFSEAQRAFAEAARLAPNEASYQTYLGAVLSRQNNWAGAEAALREAVRLAPDAAGVHANLALALANQNKLAEAEAEYREAARLDPNNPSYEKSLQALRLKREPESK